MLKMMKATLIGKDGNETTMRTYAQDSLKPEEVFADFVRIGFTVKEYEWIDTLTEARKKWNEDNPDMPINVNG